MASLPAAEVGQSNFGHDESEAARRRDVVQACRILDHQGHDHYCFGHVSARLGSSSQILVKSAGIGLGGVEACHLALVGERGENLSPSLRLHDETALHTAIYRSRRDVGAVVHTHPLTVQASTMLDFQAGVYSQDGVPFAGALAWYDTAELVSDDQRGLRFATCLGQGRAALMRGHGLVTVGADVIEATALALLLERSIAAWLMASSAGTPKPLGPELPSLIAAFERSHRSRMAAIWQEALRTVGNS